MFSQTISTNKFFCGFGVLAYYATWFVSFVRIVFLRRQQFFLSTFFRWCHEKSVPERVFVWQTHESFRKVFEVNDFNHISFTTFKRSWAYFIKEEMEKRSRSMLVRTNCSGYLGQPQFLHDSMKAMKPNLC